MEKWDGIMEEYKEKNNETFKDDEWFIDDSELEELTDEEIAISEEKENEIEKKLKEFRKKNPIEYEE